MGKGKQHGGSKKQQKQREKQSAQAAADSQPERQQKGKQRRRNREHQYSGDELERELAPLGLRIKTIEADGNCFYRSILDQLQGDGGDHLKLRQQVMDFIEEREEEYRFFIEDDEPFDKYVKRMRKEGAWAGHLELQAASLCLSCNIAVYQAGQPVWHITNFGQDAPTLHISYHDGMHYNSVRRAGDHGSGPPQPVHLAGAAAADPAAVAAAARRWGQGEVEQVVAGTGCADRERVARALDQCGASVEQAIEQLIAELGVEQDACAEGAAVGSWHTAAEGALEGAQQQQAQQQQGPSMPHHAAGLPPGAGEQGQRGAGSGDMQPPWAAQAPASCRVQLQLRPLPGDPGSVAALLRVPPAGDCPLQEPAGTQQPGTDAVGEAGAGGAQRRGAPRASGKKGVRLKEAKAAGRNQRCPCGSTKKYKNCCGALRGERGATAAGLTADGGAAGGERQGLPPEDASVVKQLQVLHI